MESIVNSSMGGGVLENLLWGETPGSVVIHVVIVQLQFTLLA